MESQCTMLWRRELNKVSYSVNVLKYLLIWYLFPDLYLSELRYGMLVSALCELQLIAESEIVTCVASVFNGSVMKRTEWSVCLAV